MKLHLTVVTALAVITLGCSTKEETGTNTEATPQNTVTEKAPLEQPEQAVLEPSTVIEATNQLDPSLFQEGALNPELDDRFAEKAENTLPNLFNGQTEKKFSAGGKLITKKDQPVKGLNDLNDKVNGAEFSVELKTN